MSKMLQIRNVPDRVHRLAKLRAAAAGLSLSDWLLFEIKQSVERPTFDEILDGLPKFEGRLEPDIATLLRRERQSR